MNDCPHVHGEENIFAFDVIQREIFYLVKPVFFINDFLDIIFILSTVVVYVIEGFIIGLINLLGLSNFVIVNNRAIYRWKWICMTESFNNFVFITYTLFVYQGISITYFNNFVFQMSIDSKRKKLPYPIWLEE